MFLFKCCFLHFGRGVQDPLSGDQGGVLGPLDPPPLDPPQPIVHLLVAGNIPKCEIK